MILRFDATHFYSRRQSFLRRPTKPTVVEETPDCFPFQHHRSSLIPIPTTLLLTRLQTEVGRMHSSGLLTLIAVSFSAIAISIPTSKIPSEISDPSILSAAEKADPYVINAAEKADPYVINAAEKADPYVLDPVQRED